MFKHPAGQVRLNKSGRFEIVNKDGVMEVTSGDIIEIIDGEKNLATRVESSDGKYYGVHHEIKEGMTARYMGR
jgi:hypothetical protein